MLKKMLPMLAMLVTGFMTKQRAAEAQPSSAGGGLGGLLGSLFGRKSNATANASPGLASMLDLDGDGNSLDDILDLVGKVMR
jgi:hypothetical protein